MVSSLPALNHNALQWHASLLERRVGLVATVVLWITCLHMKCTYRLRHFGQAEPGDLHSVNGCVCVCVFLGTKLWKWGGRRDAGSSRNCDCDTRKCLTVEDSAATCSVSKGEHDTVTPKPFHNAWTWHHYTSYNFCRLVFKPLKTSVSPPFRSPSFLLKIEPQPITPLHSNLLNKSEY